MAKPLNQKLYRKIIAEAKQRFHTWPSAYASGWVVRRYKESGGTYGSDREDTTLDRWFREKWINVCELPEIVPCGRKQSSSEDYPYCRPLRRITKETPKTVKEFTAKELETRCRRKKKNPEKRVSDPMRKNK